MFPGDLVTGSDVAYVKVGGLGCAQNNHRLRLFGNCHRMSENEGRRKWASAASTTSTSPSPPFKGQQTWAVVVPEINFGTD